MGGECRELSNPVVAALKAFSQFSSLGAWPVTNCRLPFLLNLHNRRNPPVQVLSGVWEVALFVLVNKKMRLRLQHATIAESRLTPQEEFNLAPLLNQAHRVFHALQELLKCHLCHCQYCRQLHFRVRRRLQRPTGENGVEGVRPGGGRPGGNPPNGSQRVPPLPSQRTPPQQSGGGRSHQEVIQAHRQAHPYNNMLDAQLTHGSISTAQGSRSRRSNFHPITRLAGASTCSRRWKTGSTSRPLRLPPGEETRNVTG